MKNILQAIFDGKTLDHLEASLVMNQILSGEVLPEAISAFLGALRVRKESTAELIGFARALRQAAVSVPVQRTDLIDVCGTGGDQSHTFNISTASALILAAAQIGVAKHGNRAISSQCGSADVLEALGINTNLTPEQTAQSIDQNSFGFQLATLYHPSLQKVASTRKSIGIPTLFNILGPMINPACVKRQILGIYDNSLLKTVAYALDALGSEEVMVIHGYPGVDEFSLAGPTQVAHLKKGRVSFYLFSPEEVGLSCAPLRTLKGGDAKENAQLIESILIGRETGPKRDVVLLNAAAAIMVAGRVSNMKDGIAFAKDIIGSGKAYSTLEKLRSFSCQFK